MSGIAGVVSLDGSPVDAALLRRMAGFMVSRGPDGTGVHLGAGVGLAAEALELGMGSIAARPSGEHGLRQQRFAPTCRQSLAIQVLGMHAPDPHWPTVSAGVADGRKPSIETALLH